ncbi:hypothetical protein HPP92_008739 [Vanilla planifolia]|uniref:Uncharacterized protein n=1 Tax=Vanilla planifolia TaxID=51239 RepID=A0A835RCY6_VANPL|nr:hypothetical protein HPP92_008739 [Vanilla planifolia]
MGVYRLEGHAAVDPLVQLDHSKLLPACDGCMLLVWLGSMVQRLLFVEFRITCMGSNNCPSFVLNRYHYSNSSSSNRKRTIKSLTCSNLMSKPFIFIYPLIRTNNVVKHKEKAVVSV